MRLGMKVLAVLTLRMNDIGQEEIKQ